MKQLVPTLIFLLFSLLSFSQTDREVIRAFYDAALTQGKSYAWLDYLSNQIGPRLSGSINAQKAVEYTKRELEKLGFDKVWLQPVKVPKWVRGTAEFAYIETKPGQTTPINICALGGSVATPFGGLKAQVIEVDGIDDLKNFKREEIEDKIVFLNKAMDPKLINTFHAYGQCGKERYNGAEEAAKMGAAGVLVRSLNLRLDDYPHTGSMSYGDLPLNQYIPAAAISTNHAELLSRMLLLDNEIKVFFKQNCKKMAEVLSYNVVAEIKGSEFPDEYLIVGGHLDSWDLGDGAHDDGAGVVQSMEVLRLFKEMGINPKHSLRVVLFMNEENGLRGGNKYAEEARNKGEKHLFALESDAGGFSPRGFNFEANDEQMKMIENWKSLFKPYFIHYFEKGYSGADIRPLKDEGIVLCGLVPDSQRYFDHHHAATDTFDAINKRELELGAATMATLLYLFDKYAVQP